MATAHAGVRLPAFMLVAMLSVAVSSAGGSRFRSVQVLVALADASPVAGATIAASAWETTTQRRDRLTSTSPLRKPLAAGLTGADGELALRVPDLPVVALDVEAEGIVPRRVSVPRGEDRVVIVVSAATPLRATLVWKGVGQEGVTLVWLCEDGAEIARRSGPGGELVLPVLLEPDRCSVEVLDPRWVLAGDGCQAERKTCLLRLAEAEVFDGRVVASDGETPVAGAAITMGECRRIQSNAQGRFTLRGFVDRSFDMIARRGAMVGVRSDNPPGERITLRPGVVIRGTVHDARNRRPVEGARVTVGRGGRGGFESVLTGKDGSFAVGPGIANPHEAMWLEVEHPSFVPWRQQHWITGQPPIDVELEPALVVGVVRDEEGHPVAGAFVQCSSASYVAATVPVRDCGDSLTDGDGRFRLFARSSGFGGASLGVLRKGYAPTWARMPDRPEQESLDQPHEVTIALARGVEVPVQVADEAGQPVEGAEVDAGTSGAQRRLSVVGAAADSFTVRTDREGRVVLRLTEGDLWRVEARAPGFLSQDVYCQLPRADVISLVLRRAVSVHGRVLSVDGVPVPEATVCLGMDGPLVAETDAGGRFHLRDLEPGVHRLGIDAGGVWTRRHVTAPAEDVTLTVRTLGRVAGRVTDAVTGKPVRRFRVGLAERHDKEGRFSLNDRWPGPDRIEAEAEGYRPGGVDVVVPEEGEVNADIALQPGCLLEGIVFGPDDNLGKEAKIHVSRIGPGGSSSQSDQWSTWSDGTFSRWTLCGRLRMEISHPSYRGATLDVDTTAGRSVEVRLRPPLTLNGTVEDGKGKSVAGARVWASMAESESTCAHSTTAEDGAFRLEGIPYDRVTLEVRASGFEKLRLKGVDGAEQVRLRLAPEDEKKPVAVLTARLLNPPGDVGVGLLAAFRDGKEVASAFYGKGSQRCRLELPVDGAIELRSRASVGLSGKGRGWVHAEPTTVSVRRGEEKEVDVRFGPVIIDLRVTANGAVLPYADVSVASIDPTARRGLEVELGADGSASGLGPLLPGSYEFVVSADELAAPYRLVHEIVQSGVVELDLQPVILRGAVLAPGGVPVTGAVVDLATSGAERARRVVTGSAGLFRFFDVAPGPTHLTVSAPGLETRTLELEVAPSGSPDVRIDLRRP